MGAAALIPLIIVAAVGTAAVAKSMKTDIPPVKAEQPKVTAAPIAQKSEMDKQNKRINAALLMKDFTQKPQLNQTGLLGW
jgi:hypothetical protein